MGFVVEVTARGLDRVHWIDGRDGLGAPRILPRREEAKVFPTHKDAKRVALEVVMFWGASVRYLILEE
jgi:hypothetical protein